MSMPSVTNTHHVCACICHHKYRLLQRYSTSSQQQVEVWQMSDDLHWLDITDCAKHRLCAMSTNVSTAQHHSTCLICVRRSQRYHYVNISALLVVDSCILLGTTGRPTFAGCSFACTVPSWWISTICIQRHYPVIDFFQKQVKTSLLIGTATSSALEVVRWQCAVQIFTCHFHLYLCICHLTAWWNYGLKSCRFDVWPSKHILESCGLP